jgi:hypothetical protein
MPVKDGPWQFAHAGMSWAGSPFVASASPRARIALLTTGVAGGGNGGCPEAK